MKLRHALFTAAAAAVISLPVHAQDEDPTPTQILLDQTPLGEPLRDARIVIGGLVQGGVTFGLDDPDGDEIVGRIFDFENQDPTLHQLMLFIERSVDTETQFDIGGRIEMIWGGDGRFTPSNGLLDDNGDEDNDEQFDITQIYLEVVLIAGDNALTAKVGKFITPLGYETVDPSQNAFYSHNLLFNLVPYSHTGVLLNWQASEKMQLFGGVSRGWDQSLEDNNDALDVIGGITYECSENTSSTISFTTGPEYADDNSHYKTAINLYVTHQYSDQLALAAEATYVYDSNQGQDGDAANTYGVCGYAILTLTDMVSVQGRAEWLNDTELAGGFDCNLYEATIGLDIRPFANDRIGRKLRIRPEFRADYAEHAIFDGGDDHLQMTAAIDALFTF
jgi:hypothetical protein